MDIDLTRSSDFKETLQAMAETIVSISGACGCAFEITDTFRQKTRVAVSAGLCPDLSQEVRILTDQGLAEISGGEFLFTDDVSRDTRLAVPAAASRAGIASMIALPFDAPENLQFVICLFFDRCPGPDEKSAVLLNAIAKQCALGVKNSLRHTRYLESFREVSAAIHEGEDTGGILDSIVSNIRRIMSARGCIYWIVNTAKEDIHMRATSGFQMENLSLISYETLKDVFCFENEEEVFFEDVRKDPRIPSTTTLGKQMVTSILGISFNIVDNFKGILAVYFSHPRNLAESETEFVRASGRQGAIALHKAFRYDERTLKSFRETIEGLALALEAKDICTHGHSLNVANYSWLTALEMGLSEQEADTVYHSGLLHDIGKIAMQDNILGNLGNLGPQDFETIKKHPVIGARILSPLSFLADAAELILYHHERYDGSGYPEGLTGRAIPAGSRILAVSDSFDAMTSQRPGSQTMGTDRAMSVLEQQAGTSFDPDVVRAFVRALRRNPDAVKPFKMSEDYMTRHAEALNAPEKRKSPLSRMLKKCVPGF